MLLATINTASERLTTGESFLVFVGVLTLVGIAYYLMRKRSAKKKSSRFPS